MPRAAVCPPSASSRCSTPTSSVVPPTGSGVASVAPKPGVELRGVEYRYPGAEAPVLRDISFRGAAGRDHRDHRQHRCRQDDADLELDPAPVRRPTAGAVRVDGIDVRDRDPEAAVVAGSAACRSGRTCSPERSRPTCAMADPDATDEQLWARARGRSGAATSSRRCPAARGADRAGRHQRLEAVSASGSRSRARMRPPTRHLPVRRLVLRARPRRPTLGCARRSRRTSAHATVIIVAQRVASDPSTPTRSSCSTAARSSARALTPS